ncbi:MAG: hypothetical protein V1810_04755 [Candidatus Beckwithbacteria bacterium]
MANTTNLTVGDLVVRYGKVMKVFQINQDTVSLQPFSTLKTKNSLTFTLKRGQAHEGHIRPLVSKAKLKQLLDLIIKKPLTKDRCPVYNADTALRQNKFADTLWVIKTLWLEKQEKSNTLPGGKLTIFQQALIQITEEIAAVNHISPQQAKILLLSGLKSSLKT